MVTEDSEQIKSETDFYQHMVHIKNKKPDKVFTSKNGVVTELFGAIDVEVLTRSLYGLKQKST